MFTLFITVTACVILGERQVSSSAIPIWEFLPREEKLSRLFYIFIHLVDEFCKDSEIPDCHKILTLYGASNIIHNSDDDLDRLDPYQRDAREIIWQAILNSKFKLPNATIDVISNLQEMVLNDGVNTTRENEHNEIVFIPSNNSSIKENHSSSKEKERL